MDGGEGERRDGGEGVSEGWMEGRDGGDGEEGGREGWVEGSEGGESEGWRGARE